MRHYYTNFLISLADDLDKQGKFDQADQVDQNFEEFLKLLEEGKLEFNNTYFTGPGDRDPRLQRGNLGKETSLSAISDSQ
jgi:hypothetical protein